MIYITYLLFFFFFNDTATTEIYTLSLHDALPIWYGRWRSGHAQAPVGHGHPDPEGRQAGLRYDGQRQDQAGRSARSEEHTSELQSQSNLVCRLLLEKKKKKDKSIGLCPGMHHLCP